MRKLGIIIILLLVLIGCSKNDDKKSIQNCIEQGNNQTFCEREFYGIS